ncbi:MAG: transketolase [bacterium]
MAFLLSCEAARRAVDTIKMLSVEMIQRAKSGHPGMPMGCADLVFVLWMKFLRHCPEDPGWINRDRFVLSAGHASALLYSLLHLFGYALPVEQLRRFRQWDSLTPGHPELGLTPGVESTAGPLGQGFASAVGLAVAAKMAAARVNRNGVRLLDHTVYGLCSDGDLMEGVASEAASLAGHLGLDNLVCLYDDNRITIEGSTDLAFTEDRGRRFEAYGWFVQQVDGHDHGRIETALRAAQQESSRPSLIVARTSIAKGAPTLEGSCETHGAPLGEEEVRRLRQRLDWPDAPFHVPPEVHFLFEERKNELRDLYRADREAMEAALAKDRELARVLNFLLGKKIPDDLEGPFLAAVSGTAKEATRVSSGKILQKAAALVPGICGGSADLAPSNKTFIKGEAAVARGDFRGRNFHFGVREHGMAGLCNGLALYGGWIPYAGTFLVFADYMRPSIRLAALMGLQVIYVFTHDSLFVGEDGPTHQPVEHLATLRAMPGLVTIRPADATETAAAWAVALRRTGGPTALCLSRQGLPVLDRSIYPDARNAARGAYVLSDCDGAPEVLLIATGSEVHLALQVQSSLAEESRKARVVSMPSRELFEQQDASYRDSVLPARVRKRVVIEAASPFGWDRYLQPEGLMIGVERFGKSAPYEVLAEKYGFTRESILARIHNNLL